MHNHVYIGAIHNCQAVTYPLAEEWIKKMQVAHILSHKEVGNQVICKEMNGAGDCHVR